MRMAQIFIVSLLIVSAIILSRVLADDAPFSFEPEMKATALSNSVLSEGNVIEIQNSNIKKNETLLLHRCGELCNTAKLIRRWTREDFQKSQIQTIGLTEAGQYYFWIQQRKDNNEVGPVFGAQEYFEGEEVTLTFRSGTELRISILQSTDDP